MGLALDIAITHIRSRLRQTLVGVIGVATGGGSDGNFTAPYAATLDGLGVDGKGAHTDFEQINISTIVPRAELSLWLELPLERATPADLGAAARTLHELTPRREQG